MIMDTNLRLKVAADSLKKAKNYVKASNYGRAFAHYLVFLELIESLPKRRKREKQFTEVLCTWGKLLEERNQIEHLCKCYLQGLNYFPLNVQILNNFGAHLIRIGEYEEAKKYLQSACNLAPNFLPAEKNLMTVKGQLIERWHFPMLNDYKRNMAYYKAILSYNTLNNAKVIDVGTGCGLLSLFASNNESLISIHAIEHSKIISSIANCVFEENNMTKVKLHRKHSGTMTTVDINGYADLLITEIFDVGLFGENILETLISAWENLLDQDAKIIPASATIYVTGIECTDILKKHNLINKLEDLKIQGICVTSNTDEPYESINLDTLKYRKLTETRKVLTVDFSNLNQLKELQFNPNYSIIESLKIVNTGYLTEFAIWFDVHLDDNNVITTNPQEEKVKCWEQAVKFVNHSPICYVGNDIHIKIQCQSGKLNINLANEDMLCSNCFKTSTEIITVCNDEILISELNKLYNSTVQHKTILDTFEFPLLGLKYAKNESNKLYCIAKNEKDKLFIQYICNINGIPEQNVSIIEGRMLNHILEACKFDIIVLNPICKNGTLHDNFVLNYELCKMCLNPGGMIYPESVNLICQAIESDYLYSFNIVNDENLFGFHLADQVNQYSVNEHFDLDKNFEHKKLSEPQNMGNVPIPNNEAIIRHTRCTLQHSKVVDGILYWYELIMNDQIKIDTSACTHYNYACFLVTRQETQQDRSDLTICTKFYQGLIKIHCEMCLLISL